MSIVQRLYTLTLSMLLALPSSLLLLALPLDPSSLPILLFFLSMYRSYSSVALDVDRRSSIHAHSCYASCFPLFSSIPIYIPLSLFNFFLPMLSTSVFSYRFLQLLLSFQTFLSSSRYYSPPLIRFFDFFSLFFSRLLISSSTLFSIISPLIFYCFFFFSPPPKLR